MTAQNLVQTQEIDAQRLLPNNYERDLYLRLSSLNQGRSSAEEYIREFEQLRIRSGIEEEPEQTMARFLRGLDPSIIEKVNIQPYWSFENVCKFSFKVEKYLKGKKMFSSSYNEPTAPPNP